MDATCDQLLQDAIAKGTVANVAEQLGVEPGDLYRWIGGLQPAEREARQVVRRLMQLELFEDYFQRRRKPSSRWQQ